MAEVTRADRPARGSALYPADRWHAACVAGVVLLMVPPHWLVLAAIVVGLGYWWRRVMG